MATTLAQPDRQQDEQYLDAQAAAFQALEQRVLRAIELLRNERELRTAAEQQLHASEERALMLELQMEEQISQLAAKSVEAETHLARVHLQTEQIHRMEGDLSEMQGERDQVRQRVERILQHLDEFTGA